MFATGETVVWQRGSLMTPVLFIFKLTFAIPKPTKYPENMSVLKLYSTCVNTN